MKTIYKMTIAAVLAATMGAASAVKFTGTNATESNLPDSFEFSMPGVSDVLTGPGLSALTQINTILDGTSSGTQGGTNIDKDLFWSAFVSDKKVQIFRFDHAEPFIEELIFTVTGEAYNGNAYVAAEDVATSSIVNNVTINSNAKADFLAKASNVTDSDGNSIGSYIDGQLKATGEAAVALLSKLGFSQMTGALGDYTSTQATDATTGNITASLSLDENVTSVIVKPTNGNHIAALLVTESSTIIADINAANIKGVAFTSANDLIGKIAAQLKSGYILDVGAAATAINSVLDQHNNFLGASVVAQAKLLKPIIKNIGLQIAAVELGKTIKTSNLCNGGTGSEDCVSVGLKFVDISAQITTVNADVAAYQTAVDAIETLTNNIIEFNLKADGFSSGNTTEYDSNGVITKAGSGAAGDIEAQFGTITVVEGTVLFNQLVADEANSTNTAPDLTDAFGTVVGDIEDFDSSITIDGELVDLF